jgi:hypothetical protein
MRRLRQDVRLVPTGDIARYGPVKKKAAHLAASIAQAGGENLKRAAFPKAPF